MNDIHKVSANLKFISYADDTTITSPLCSFTHGGNDDISLVEALINLINFAVVQNLGLVCCQ